MALLINIAQLYERMISVPLCMAMPLIDNHQKVTYSSFCNKIPLLLMSCFLKQRQDEVYNKIRSND